MSVLKSSLIATFHDRISGPARGATGALGGLQRAGRGFGAAQARMNAPVAGATRGLVAMGAAYLGVRQGYDKSVGGALRLETVMADVAKKTTLTAHELQGVENQIRNLSNLKGGMAMTELGKLYAQAGQFGIANNELKRFVQLGNKAGIAFDMSATETANSLSKLKNAFGLDMPGLTGLADSINYTADSAGTSEQSLIDFLLRTAAASKTFGITGQEMSAFGATLNEIGIESAKAGTGMNAMMAKLSGLTKSKKAVAALDRFAGKGYSKNLQAKFYKTPVDAMKEFFQIVKKMDVQSRTGLLIDFFGLEYQDDAAAIANNIDKIVGRLDKLGDASKYAGSVDKTFEIFANTSEEKLKRLGRVASNLGAMFGAKVLPPITDFAERLSDTFSTLESRVTVFDTIGAKVQGFVTGLGFSGENNVAAAFNSLWDATFGRADELTSDVEKMGASFETFRQMGASLRNFGADVAWAGGQIEAFFGLDTGSVGAFASDMAGWGLTLGAAGLGFSLLAGPLRAVGSAALFLTGIKPAWSLLRFLGGLVKLGGKAGGVSALAKATTALGKASRAPGLKAGKPPVKMPGTPKVQGSVITNPNGFGKVTQKSPLRGSLNKASIEAMQKSARASGLVKGPGIGLAQKLTSGLGKGALMGVAQVAGEMAIEAGLNEVDKALGLDPDRKRVDASTGAIMKRMYGRFFGQDAARQDPAADASLLPKRSQWQRGRAEADTRFSPMKGGRGFSDHQSHFKANGTGGSDAKASGVQEVRVTNPTPPNINMTVSVVVNEASNAATIAQQLGNELKQQLSGLQADMEPTGP